MSPPLQICAIFVIVTISEPEKLSLRGTTLLLALNARVRIRTVSVTQILGILIHFIVSLFSKTSGRYLWWWGMATSPWHFSHWEVGPLDSLWIGELCHCFDEQIRWEGCKVCFWTLDSGTDSLLSLTSHSCYGIGRTRILRPSCSKMNNERAWWTRQCHW